MSQTTDIEKFKSGTWGKGLKYKYFIPEKINQIWIWNDPVLSELLEKASLQLGELNSFARFVPNIDLFIHLHVTKESVVSSRIEGTQTSMDEAFLRKEDIAPERKNDWQEVTNYTNALNQAIDDLNTLPLSSRLLCKAHHTLMQHVRGENKQPADFRLSQNWIGGNSLADAVFIPPTHEMIGELMSDLEHFLHNTEIHVPRLIRIAIAHYQFETIHPFLDGNGRIGRLLITLYLVDQKLMDKPLLYLSHFFEKNKTLYYDNLTRVREKSDMLHWVKYFLVGIEETAKQAAFSLKQMIELKYRLEEDIQKNWGRRSQQGYTLLQSLFQNPVVHMKDVQEACKLSPKAAGDLVQLFEGKKILKELTGQSRNRVFVFEQYLNLFK
jgi:Fic family protein